MWSNKSVQNGQNYHSFIHSFNQEKWFQYSVAIITKQKKNWFESFFISFSIWFDSLLLLFPWRSTYSIFFLFLSTNLIYHVIRIIIWLKRERERGPEWNELNFRTRIIDFYRCMYDVDVNIMYSNFCKMYSTCRSRAKQKKILGFQDSFFFSFSFLYILTHTHTHFEDFLTFFSPSFSQSMLVRSFVPMCIWFMSLKNKIKLSCSLGIEIGRSVYFFFVGWLVHQIFIFFIIIIIRFFLFS